MVVCEFYHITLAKALALTDAEINTVHQYLALKEFLQGRKENPAVLKRLEELK